MIKLIMERYILFSSRTRPDLDLSRVSRFALLDLREGDRVPWVATSFEQFDGNQSSERKRAGREKRSALRSQKGLTDTWPLNGANLRAPAVTLLIR